MCHNSLPAVVITGIGAHLVFILDVSLLIYDLTIFMVSLTELASCV